MQANSLEQYLHEYGPLIGQQVAEACAPLHTPTKDPLAPVDLLRAPFPAQHHVITAGIEALKRQDGLLISAECGVGKTLMAQAICQGHAQTAYRAIVLCPPHLVGKWEREIRETLQNAQVKHLRSYHDVTQLNPKLKPFGRSWWIVSSTRAKMGAKWRPAYKVGKRHPRTGLVLCPSCFNVVLKKDPKTKTMVPVDEADLAKKRHECPVCDEPLWSYTHEIDRWPIASFIHKHLKGFFQYAVIDECFPGDTMVSTPAGPKRIADIRVGDLVTSYKDGRLVSRRVVRTIRKRLTGSLVRVRHQHGEVTCTPNHKFYVQGRYIPANSIQSRDCLVTECDHETGRANRVADYLRDVRSGVLPQPGIEAEILQSPLLRSGQAGVEHQTLQSVREGVLSPALADGLLQHGVLGGTSPDSPDLQDVRRDVLLPQAEAEVLRPGVRSTHGRGHSPATIAATGIGLVEALGRLSSRHSADAALGQSVFVDRSGTSPCEAGDRSGRRVTPQAGPDRPRPTEGNDSPIAGLGSDSFLEFCDLPGYCSSGGEGSRCGRSAVTAVEASEESPEFVYDLEVEDTHCYFAAGVLVSNCHQAKSADTAIGQAVGSLAAACDKTIGMTGTLLGGFANHIRPLLYRIAPSTLIEEKLGWDSEMEFNERYGRIERVVTETGNKSSRDNKQSRGKQTRSQKYVRPGVMPTLFGRHLIGNTVFLGLDEVADHLPPIWEDNDKHPGTGPVAVDMDRELADAYTEVEEALTAAVKDMLKQRDKRLLSKMLQTLLGYCDHPWGWGDIGYWRPTEYGEMEWVHVITPPSLRQDRLYPKEEQILADVLADRDAGRQSWVYSVMTGERDVNERLRKIFADAGLRVGVLRSSVETTDREDWIAEHGPKLDVCISHPQLVETGLDLFCKKGRYNFNAINFFSTGYSTFTTRQAARRAWRIGQVKECIVRYYAYGSTMQARCLSLMGKKLQASQSIEGKFSSEGLAALSGDEGTMETALARSLVERLDDLDVGRSWQKHSAAPRELALV